MSIQFSDKTAVLFAAMQAIQQECGIIGKDAENPHFKSEYVSLEKLWTTLKPLLKKHGLLVIQTPGNMQGTIFTMNTAVIHVETGEFVISAGQMDVGKSGPQAIGSAITYARRYFLACCLGVVAGDEDDDGEAAEGRGAQAEKEAKAQAAKAGLRQRKDAVLAWVKKNGNDPVVWAGEVLGRKVDDNVKLNSEAELSKLEAEMQKLEKLGLTK